ncbi:hypothetical protein AMS68_000649 [Peltaster fructicola]|uniref:F-box domain-containing protein n=1 Tax=Peltaster fructicola TaxID=286661 RepID=A0A6H0XK79_9PEZI|nr:hypothetical protein AMS68_000649 [Peltaster fructicola]
MTQSVSSHGPVARSDSDTPHHINGKVTIPERTSSQRKAWSRLKGSGTYAFDEIPKLRKTPWEAQRKQKPAAQPVNVQRPNGLSAIIFSQFPTRIHHRILEQLTLSYITGMMVDVSGTLRDLQACCLVNKRWLHPAREHLYHNIWLLRNETTRKRKYGIARQKSRLQLLLRTLAEERSLAQLVHCLSVTPYLQRELLAPKTLLSRSRHALDLLHEVIELCPMLEQLLGFLPELAPHYATFFQTLLRRPYLQSLVWWTHRDSWCLVDLDRLSHYEHSWQHLHILVLSQGNSAKSLSLTPGSILRMVHHMPALQSLMLAGLSRKDVNDETLQSLPALRRLRLDDLAGVTDKGIVDLSEGENAGVLTSLTMSGLKLKSMNTIILLLDGFDRLERLRLVQMEAPEYTVDDEDFLESQSLRYLHWETLVPGNATKAIADSISQDGFPALSLIKAPCDHEGHLQAVCRPIHEQELTPDDLEFMERGRLHGSSYSIRLAQLRAQLRIQEQRRRPSFNFVVKDEDEALQHTDVIGAYLGQLDSQIEYCLEPDIPGSTVALSHLSDLLKPHLPEQTDASMSSLNLSIAQSPAYTYAILF